MSVLTKNAIAVLSSCVAECNNCFKSCLEDPDIKKLAKCIMLDRQCTEVCAFTISMVSLGHKSYKDVINLCIDTCVACATECEKHKDMTHCQVCAEMCRKCADVCKQL